MSPFERFYLRALGVTLAAYAGFFALMTEKMVLASQTPTYLALLLLGYLLALGAVMGVLWALAMKADHPTKFVADERENQIDYRAERMGFHLLDMAIFALMLLVVADAAWGLLGSYSLNRPEAVIFALVTLTTLAGVARFGAGFYFARRI